MASGRGCLEVMLREYHIISEELGTHRLLLALVDTHFMRRNIIVMLHSEWLIVYGVKGFTHRVIDIMTLRSKCESSTNSCCLKGKIVLLHVTVLVWHT